jgi:hypothetical protein
MLGNDATRKRSQSFFLKRRPRMGDGDRSQEFCRMIDAPTGARFVDGQIPVQSAAS